MTPLFDLTPVSKDDYTIKSYTLSFEHNGKPREILYTLIDTSDLPDVHYGIMEDKNHHYFIHYSDPALTSVVQSMYDMITLFFDGHDGYGKSYYWDDEHKSKQTAVYGNQYYSHKLGELVRKYPKLPVYYSIPKDIKCYDTYRIKSVVHEPDAIKVYLEGVPKDKEV